MTVAYLSFNILIVKYTRGLSGLYDELQHSLKFVHMALLSRYYFHYYILIIVQYLTLTANI